jgi:hypothetical protein
MIQRKEYASRRGTASRQAVGRRAYLEPGGEGGGDGAAEQGPPRGALAEQTASRRAPLQGRRGSSSAGTVERWRGDGGDPLLRGPRGSSSARGDGVAACSSAGAAGLLLCGDGGATTASPSTTATRWRLWRARATKDLIWIE